jgi:Ca2+-binding EF-hand superfamily protein
MATRNQVAIAEVFNKYDTEKTGFITKAQLKDCIFDLNGRQLDDVELNHIFDLMEGDTSGISLAKFTNVMEQFFRYCYTARSLLSFPSAD